MDLIASYQDEVRVVRESLNTTANQISPQPEETMHNLSDLIGSSVAAHPEHAIAETSMSTHINQSILRDYQSQNGNDRESMDSFYAGRISETIVSESDSLVTRRESRKRTSEALSTHGDEDQRNTAFVSSFVDKPSDTSITSKYINNCGRHQSSIQGTKCETPSSNKELCDNSMTILQAATICESSSSREEPCDNSMTIPQAATNCEASPSNKLLHDHSVAVPQSVADFIRSDKCIYTESDLCIERKKAVARLEEIVEIQTTMYNKLKEELDALKEKDKKLEKDNHDLFSFINSWSSSIDKIKDEVRVSEETQWKEKMQSLVENSDMMCATLQDELDRQRVRLNEQKEQLDRKNERIAELQEAVQVKEQAIAQAKQQVIMLEERIEVDKKEISELEGLKLSLLHENENRVDFYRSLYEEEMKQKQEFKERLEKHMNQNGAAQQKVEEYERTIQRLKENLEEEKQVRQDKERECSSLQTENQRLVLAVNNLVEKNDRNSAKIKQLQEEYSSIMKSTNAEIIVK